MIMANQQQQNPAASLFRGGTGNFADSPKAQAHQVTFRTGSKFSNLVIHRFRRVRPVR
jgi:hypothetical protein